MTLRQKLMQAHSLAGYIRATGAKVPDKPGAKAMCSCPLHVDKTPSCSLDLERGLWKCFSCGQGGTVIDMHMRLTGLSVKEAMFDLAEKGGVEIDDKPVKAATYVYRDKLGREQMRVDRIEMGRKKKFRQYRVIGGNEVNGIEGVCRTLWNIEKWHAKEQIALAEGEKSVQALEALGSDATTNPGGSGAWLPSYAGYLDGKHVEIWPDNDEAGEKWMDAVVASLEGKVAALRVMRVPPEYNDIADLVTAKGVEYAAEMVVELSAKTDWIERGVKIELLSAAELEAMYKARSKVTAEVCVDLARWLPSLGEVLRPMMPGDLGVVVGDTGTGKTAVMVNIAQSQTQFPVIVFELELSPEDMAERYMARWNGLRCREIESKYKHGGELGTKGWGHIYTCPLSSASVETMETIVRKSELKIGRAPGLVLVDYIGLVDGGKGKRYERISDVAESLKRMARATNTVCILGSQVYRDKDRIEVGLHDAKESGSIENSAQMVMGIWRPAENQLCIRVNKQTRGSDKRVIWCEYDGDRQMIREVERRERHERQTNEQMF